MKKILLISLHISLLINNSNSLRCYQCSGSDSKQPFQCNEWLNEDDIDIEPESCDSVYDAKFCVKHTGRFEGTSINCYQCSVAETLDCSDGMIVMGSLKPTNCNHIFEAQYCIKTTSLYGGIGAKRYCSSLDLGNYCNYVRQPGDKLTYRTCVYTCSGDGCNSSTILYPNNIIFYLIFSYFFIT